MKTVVCAFGVFTTIVATATAQQLPFPPELTTDRVQRVLLEVRLAETKPSPALKTVATRRGDILFMSDTRVISNNDVVDAVILSGSRQIEVVLKLTEEAADRMWQVTSGHVGRLMVVIVDGEILSATMITTPRRDLRVEGFRSRAEAERLVDALKR
jgi:preprotein translocase subunit SecD